MTERRLVTPASLLPGHLRAGHAGRDLLPPRLQGVLGAKSREEIEGSGRLPASSICARLVTAVMPAPRRMR